MTSSQSSLVVAKIMVRGQRLMLTVNYENLAKKKYSLRISLRMMAKD
ncbi:hypothetical protein GFS31_39480 [Leptolyngbya sp. BL0902]|nr:hypothetical protein GFS31_39480 [Leptolyngbya sp. BL0902]